MGLGFAGVGLKGERRLVGFRYFLREGAGGIGRVVVAVRPPIALILVHLDKMAKGFFFTLGATTAFQCA